MGLWAKLETWRKWGKTAVICIKEVGTNSMRNEIVVRSTLFNFESTLSFILSILWNCPLRLPITLNFHPTKIGMVINTIIRLQYLFSYFENTNQKKYNSQTYSVKVYGFCANLVSLILVIKKLFRAHFIFSP